MNPNTAASSETLSEKEIVSRYQTLKQQIQQIMIKIEEFENDKNEQELVLKQLLPLNDDRKCWRQVGNVLLEQTVGQVKPVLESTSRELQQAIQNLNEELRTKETEFLELKEKYKIREVDSSSLASSSQAQKP
ncbi:prefoldin subunit 2 [Galdieria sulphuraria]|uniref:Prefoldin subunit 2 n=1 Tax=Galdieria sulphuraria TaxID=130081 RepID=M2Y4R8_GALSU|nr:prefoldin subunit 2 [Galdieria sulphuraria]EME30953.1 prefoldin subunit 2 [Galdieria sulphuraria]|eukprot:XP_005707473.1 prefoldin subunit 2 [Galdieria sulphuraria]